MGEGQTPQPDAVLLILPEHGGQSSVSGDPITGYFSGAPEMIVEVAVTSYSRDFGTKKRLYERMCVREYLIVVPREKKVVAMALTPSGFEPIEPGPDGILRSRFFPGLWLDIATMWTLDLQQMNAVLQQGLATPDHADFTAQLASRKH